MRLEEICKWIDVLESELPFDTIYTLENGEKQSCDVHELLFSIRRNIPNIYHCCNCGAITSRHIDKCPVCGSTTFWKYNVEGDELW